MADFSGVSEVSIRLDGGPWKDMGVELMVSEKHDLPLVSFMLLVQGGADQFEDDVVGGQDLPGVVAGERAFMDGDADLGVEPA
mgnify:CR=1 FL=1